MTTFHLTGDHQRTFQQLYLHPIPHNIQWRDVWSMLIAITDVKANEESNGNLKVVRNSQILTLRRPRGKDLADKKELLQIRHFLERSESPLPRPEPRGTHLLVVIDHHKARVYSAQMHGLIPQRFTPYDPDGLDRDFHYAQDDSSDHPTPERKRFYEAVAKTVRGARQIVMFDFSTGAESIMDALVADLKNNHPEIAERIVGTHGMEEPQLTDDQLFAKARPLFAASSPRAETT